MEPDIDDGALQTKESGPAGAPRFSELAEQGTLDEQSPTKGAPKPSGGGGTSGLLPGWLRRGKGKAEGSAAQPEPDTPTWSESTDLSSSLEMEGAAPGDATRFPVEKEVVKGPGPSGAGPAAGPGLGSLFGGWLTGAYGTASSSGAKKKDASTTGKAASNAWSSVGSALGGAVRGGAKALQKFTGREKLHEYREARERLERTAAELRGEARVAGLQRWCAVLRELGAQNHFIRTGGGTPLAPVSPSESDWQQLHLSPFDGGPRQSHDAELAVRANDVLFVEEKDAEPMTFREVFLRSSALQNIVAGYVESPPRDADEEALLAQLLGLCVGGDTTLHGVLVDALLELGAAVGEAREAGGQAQSTMHTTIAAAIGAMKLQAGVESLDRRMAALREEIETKAAAAAERHKFSAGASEPAADSSPSKLASGVAATAEVMGLAAALNQLADQRSALLRSAPVPRYQEQLGSLRVQAAGLDTAVTHAETCMKQVEAQHADGLLFRGTKLEEMNKTLDAASGEVEALEAREAALAAQLAQVQAQLARAQASRADLEEGRAVFEEGNSFTLAALQQQMEQLARDKVCHLAETEAVEKCQVLLTEVERGYEQNRKAELAAGAGVESGALREYMHATSRHLYFQRAELQLMLRQLRFCSSELKELAGKDERVAEMGMQAIAEDLSASRQRLQEKYLEAEWAALERVAHVEAIRSAVQGGPLPPPPTSASAAGEVPGSSVEAVPAATGAAAGLVGLPHIRVKVSPAARGVQLSEELADLFGSIQALSSELAALQRPTGLPPAGQKMAAPLGAAEKAGPAGEPEVSDKAEASGIVSSPAAALGSDMEFSEASAESSSLQEVVDSLLLSPTASLGQHDDSGASLESGSLTGGGASEQAQIGNELAALELSDPADEKQPSQDQAVQRGLEGDN